MDAGGGRSLAQGVPVVRTGVDAVALSRIRRSIQRYGEAFLSRVLTAEEADYCRGARLIERVAGRAAAKEAVMKVLGQGWPSVGWTDISVLPDSSRRPRVTLSGKALSVAESLGITSLDVSITHEADAAIAVAVALSGSGR